MGSASTRRAVQPQGLWRGPYFGPEFKPGDVVTLVANPNCREANKPFFSQVDAQGRRRRHLSSARAVLQASEYDYAWNLSRGAGAESALAGSKGDTVLGAGGGVSRSVQPDSPQRNIDRQALSASRPDTRSMTDQRVRQALALAIDRNTIAKQLCSQTGDAAANVLTTPTDLASKATAFEFNIEKANQVLDQAGSRSAAATASNDPDGTRTSSADRSIAPPERAGYRQTGLAADRC